MVNLAALAAAIIAMNSSIYLGEEAQKELGEDDENDEED